MQKTLKIRFNTENTGSLFWRVIIADIEYLADHINILVPTFTSQDVLPGGRVKWHISADYNELIWDGTRLTVK